MLRSIVLSSLALTLSMPALAAEPLVLAKSPVDGQTFQYATHVDREDVVHIRGNFVDSGEKFAFQVTPTGRVRGSVGLVPVAFTVSKQQRDRLAKPFKAAAEQAVAGSAPLTYAAK